MLVKTACGCPIVFWSVFEERVMVRKKAVYRIPIPAKVKIPRSESSDSVGLRSSRIRGGKVRQKHKVN